MKKLLPEQKTSTLSLRVRGLKFKIEVEDWFE